MATIPELLDCVDDPDDDSTRAYQLVDEIARGGDESLIPLLAVELDTFLDAGHFYGRDVIADALAGLGGTDVLPLLIAASARDLGDDQDGLQSTILDLMSTNPHRARVVLGELRAEGPPEIQSRVGWAYDR
ncbi:hypothetical protein [Micromonospora tarensis]|uniref:HEAT repeat-containing protein n=1 Tax=Micromonospora tarensis TaxID=2806100 RepID=A0ABS1YJ39_9ACTN|nr:hypothetical protein [Micromonospora tarensis]MBM0277436.1 hypothetical protein [Micromonospora tarensis]